MIGIFDSGYGGLSVFASLAKKFKSENFIYFGDNARAPYGNRSNAIIENYTKEAIHWLFQNGADLVVIACNTASASALPNLSFWIEENFGKNRVFGVIEPTVDFVSKKLLPKKDKIAVVGTNSTIRSGVYGKLLEEKGFFFTEKATPLLAPLVESGDLYGQMAEHIVANYFSPITSLGYYHIILACTHYFFLRDIIEKMYPHLYLYDASDAMGVAILPFLKKDKKEKAVWKFYTTDLPDPFSNFVLKNLGLDISAGQISL